MNPAAIIRMLRKAAGEQFTGRMHGYNVNTASRANPAAALDFDNYAKAPFRRWSPDESAAYDRYVPPGSSDEANVYFRHQRLMPGDEEPYNPSGYPREWNGAGESLEDVERGRFDGLSPTDVELSRSRVMGDFDEGPEDEAMRRAILGIPGGVTIKDGMIEIPNANLSAPVDPTMDLARQIQMLIRGQLDQPEFGVGGARKLIGGDDE